MRMSLHILDKNIVRNKATHMLTKFSMTALHAAVDNKNTVMVSVLLGADAVSEA